MCLWPRFCTLCANWNTGTSCIGRKRQKGDGDDGTKWTIRRRWLTGLAMFTIAHVLGVLHIEDYNELSFLMLAICLTFASSLFPSVPLTSPYTCLLYVQGFPLIFFDSSSLVRLPPADQTRWPGSSLFISPPPLPPPRIARHSFDPSWYNESVLPVRRSSTEDVKVKCDSDSSWCHDAGVQQDWLFLSCRAIPSSFQKCSDDIRLSAYKYYGFREQGSNICTCHLRSVLSLVAGMTISIISIVFIMWLLYQFRMSRN